MNQIRKTSIDQADIFPLDHVLWGYEEYQAKVFAQIAYDDAGFTVRFTVGEADPLREKTQHLSFVHEDSCVEFFVNFMPEKSNKYINFEVNANGAMNAAFRSDRYDGNPLTVDEIEGLHIVPVIGEKEWTVTYKIGFDFIQKYYPEFDMDHCNYLLGNLYKCGDKTEKEHYLSYYIVGTEHPDYHRPEYFGRFEIGRDK